LFLSDDNLVFDDDFFFDDNCFIDDNWDNWDNRDNFCFGIDHADGGRLA